MIDVFLHLGQRRAKRGERRFIDTLEQCVDKLRLHCVTFLDDRCRLLRELELNLPAVMRDLAAHEQSLLNQAIDVDRHQVRLDATDLHDVPGALVLRMIREKHQDIERRLRDVELMAERLTAPRIRPADLICKRNVKHCSSIFDWFIFEQSEYKTILRRCKEGGMNPTVKFL